MSLSWSGGGLRARSWLTLLLIAAPLGVRGAGTGSETATAPPLDAAASAPSVVPRSVLHRLALGELGGWLTLDVELGGVTSRWLLDTGASRHFISRALAQRLALPLGARLRVQMPLGLVDGREVALPSLRVGALLRTDQTAVVIDLAEVFGPAATPLDGVLGVPLLQTAGLLLDLRAGIATWLPAGTDSCEPGLVAVKLRQHRGLPVVTVEARGALLNLVLDSGNPAGVVRVASQELPTSTSLAVAAGQELSVLERLALGPYQRSDVPLLWLVAPALAGELSAGGVHGLLGTAWLDGARWQIDLAQDRLCVEAGGHTTPGGFGLTLYRQGDGLAIGTVLAGSPAAQAGLRAGDVLRRWAGLPPETALPDLWQAVQGKEEVELEAGTPPRPITLRRAIFAPRAILR